LQVTGFGLSSLRHKENGSRKAAKVASYVLKNRFRLRVTGQFTPLESPSIYTGDSGNRKHQLLIEGEVKALLFLTGLTDDRYLRLYKGMDDLKAPDSFEVSHICRYKAEIVQQGCRSYYSICQLYPF